MEIEYIKQIVDYGIIGILLFMSILAIGFGLERVFFFRKVDVTNYPHIRSLELDLTKHLSTIASVGSNAPYVGLLGTVLAIILTFYLIGQKGGNIEAGEIMRSLALALKATAAGLVVAIPATVIYNALSDRVDRLLAEWEIKHDGKR